MGKIPAVHLKSIALVPNLTVNSPGENTVGGKKKVMLEGGSWVGD